MKLPSTNQRVIDHTPDQYNQQIHDATVEHLQRYGHDAVAIDHRLDQLEEEWDIERMLEANASGLALAGLMLGASVHKRFYLLPAAVTAFLLQHALQGWCPPLRLFRRLGFRTQREIQEERHALKAMRGDYDHLTKEQIQPDTVRAEHAYEAAHHDHGDRFQLHRN